MNVYDFDGTVYRGDSTVDFYWFCLFHKPSLIRFLPRQLAALVAYKRKKISKTRCKEKFFSFLAGMDCEKLTARFWDKKQKKIEAWYLAARKPDDVIISASPVFLLRPICDRLGIERVIASRVDPRNGHFNGENCYGVEKTHRFKKELGGDVVDAFYSDSLSDLPMARMANTAYFVKKGKVLPWDTHEKG